MANLKCKFIQVSEFFLEFQHYLQVVCNSNNLVLHVQCSVYFDSIVFCYGVIQELRNVVGLSNCLEKCYEGGLMLLALQREIGYQFFWKKH